MTPFNTSDCGSQQAIDCLLNELASGASVDLVGDPRCRRCGKSVDEIESQLSSFGKGLRESDDAVPAKEHDFLALVEQAAAPKSCNPIVGESPPTLIGPYEIKELLGRGGMGAVYRATHSRLKKDVAIKLLPADAVDDRIAARFEREMESAGKLDHPNVVRALNAGEADGRSFLIMELLRGHDVAQLTSGGKSLPVADACEIARQAAVGLHYAHQNGLVHRDVKPANLMLTVNAQGNPVVKVMDLGLALLTQSAPSRELTDQGQLMGTLEFMSPEQANDTKSVDYRADIYALGATLYRLLTGTVPFGGEYYDTPVRRLKGLSKHEVPPIDRRRSGLPADLVELVHRMLARDPADRPSSMAKVARELAPLTKDHDLGKQFADSIGHNSDSSVTLFQDDSNASQFDTDPKTIRALLDTDPAATSGLGNRSGSSTRLLSKRRIVGVVALCAILATGIGWWRVSDGGSVGMRSVLGQWLQPGVVTNLNDDGTGSLRAIIAIAEPGDTIRFDRSLSGKSIVLTSGQLTIKRDLNIDGSDLDQPMTIDGDGQSRVFDCATDTQVSISGLAITGGQATGKNPIDSSGGGIRSAGYLVLKGVTVSDNRADYIGGGISVVSTSQLNRGLQMADCSVTGNVAVQAGGISIEGDYEIRNSTIARNIGTAAAGGIHQSGGGHGMVINSTIAENQAPRGSGMHVFQNSSVELVHVTITNNGSTSVTPATAVWGNIDSELQIQNSVIAGNGPPNAFDFDLGTGSRLVTQGTNFIGCIHTHNPQALTGIINEVVTLGPEFLGRVNIVEDIAATENDSDHLETPPNPGLAPLADYGGPVESMLPLPGSPLIDAAISNVADAVLQRDARGAARPFDPDDEVSPVSDVGAMTSGRPDIGAVEFDRERDQAAASQVIASSTEHPSPPVRSFLRFLHVSVLSHGTTETLSGSEYVVMPFVTYTSMKPSDAKYQQGAAEWKQMLAEHGGKEQSGFVLPEWLEDLRRVPLPRGGCRQKVTSWETNYGHSWSQYAHRDTGFDIEVEDNPETPDRDERFEVAFLIISRFRCGAESVERFEFRTFEQLTNPLNEIGPRGLVGQLATFNSGTDSEFQSLGLRCGQGIFLHHFAIEFIGPDKDWRKFGVDASRIRSEGRR